MVTKLNYKTQLYNMVTKRHCITLLHNNIIKQSYIKQLCNVVTQRHDETLYRAVVLALYQAKVRRSGGLFHFTRLKRRSARARQARQMPACTIPDQGLYTGVGAGKLELELEKGSCINAAGNRSKFNIKLTQQLES